MRAWFLALVGLVAVGCARPPRPHNYRIEPLDEAAGPSHTLALGRIEKQELAFVADEDRSGILTFSLRDVRFVNRTRLPGKPSSVRLLATGELAVTLRDRSQVAFLEATHDGLRVTATTDVCTEPVSTNESDGELYVVCAWGHALDTVSTRPTCRLRAWTCLANREPSSSIPSVGTSISRTRWAHACSSSTAATGTCWRRPCRWRACRGCSPG
jgi:hypothetical protein